VRISQLLPFGFDKQLIVRIFCDTTLRTLVWPGAWKWVGAAAPANIAANKTGLLQLWRFGASESDVAARWLIAMTNLMSSDFVRRSWMVSGPVRRRWLARRVWARGFYSLEPEEIE
jgi:hypothetical protein